MADTEDAAVTARATSDDPGRATAARRGSFYDAAVLDLPIGLALSSPAMFPRRHSISHVPSSRRYGALPRAAALGRARMRGYVCAMGCSGVRVATADVCWRCGAVVGHAACLALPVYDPLCLPSPRSRRVTATALALSWRARTPSSCEACIVVDARWACLASLSLGRAVVSNVVAAAPSSRSVDQHRASLMRRLMVGQPPGAPSAAAPPSAVTSDSELKYQFAGSAGERRDRSYSAFPGSYSVRGDSTKVSDLFQSLGGSVVPSEPDAGAGSDGATVDSSASKQAAVGATAAADGGAATLSSSTNGGLVILCVVGALVASAGVLRSCVRTCGVVLLFVVVVARARSARRAVCCRPECRCYDTRDFFSSKCCLLPFAAVVWLWCVALQAPHQQVAHPPPLRCDVVQWHRTACRCSRSTSAQSPARTCGWRCCGACSGPSSTTSGRIPRPR